MREALISLVILCGAVSAWAINPNVRISQYGHTAWRIQDGFLGSAPRAIAQYADGYLWIGGGNGLVRFDGARFLPWTPPPGKHLLSPDIGFLLAARDGSLWIGTSLGLSHWTNKDLINYSSYANASITSIIEDEDGTIWVTRARITDGTGPLCQVTGMDMRCYGKADGLPEDRYSSMARDSAGNFWLAGSTGLTRWRPGSFQTYYPSELKSNAGQVGVSAVLPNPDGSLWVGTAQPGLGLQQLAQGVWKPFVVPELNSRTLEVHSNALYRGRQNALWVGTYRQGIYRIYGSEVDHFDSSEGLSSDYASKFFEDREGNLWVLTSGGIDCFRDLKITTFSAREGLTTPEVDSVQASREGPVWIGGPRALNILDAGRVSSIPTGKGSLGDQVTSLFEDHAGQRWVGLDNSLFIFEKGGRFTRINKPDGSPTGMIYGITEDVDNNLWVLSFGPPRTLIRIYDRKARQEIPTPHIPPANSLVADPRGGIWLGLMNGDLARYQQGRTEIFRFEHKYDSRVNQVLVSPDGSVLGATAFGLIGWSDGKQRTLSAKNGLPCDGVNAVVQDSSGALWLYMPCGLVKIAKSDLQRLWVQPNVRLQPIVFDVFDGVQPGSGAPFESKAVRTPDDRLWFANGRVLQMIDPSHLALNLMAPAVRVEQVIADRKSYSLESDLRVPPGTRDLEIDYTALSFTVPQKVRFRYRLEGRTADWVDPGTRRQAFYTDLRPGTYRFHVIACNNDGVWNNDGATLDFTVAPAWYQTNTFRLLCVAMVVIGAWIFYILRVQHVTRKISARFDERLAERTRIARELHDTLMQTIQASKLIADHALRKRDNPDQAYQSMEELSSWLGQATVQGREALSSLRLSAVETNDLIQALKRATDECRNQNAIAEVGFSVVGDAREMHPFVRDEVYRISYEAIRNACTHSKCTRLDVVLRYAQVLAIRVKDNGRGIDPVVAQKGKDGHFGLQGMRERATRIHSTLTIVSSTDSGTEISIEVPGRIAFRKPRASTLEAIKATFARTQRIDEKGR